MNIFISTAIIVSFVFLSLFQIVRNRRFKASASVRQRLSAGIMLSIAASVLADLVAGGNTCMRLPFELSAGLFPMYVLTSSLFDVSVLFASVSSVCISSIGCFYLLSLAEVFVMPADCFYVCCVAGISMLMSGYYLYGIWTRLKDVKSVMRAGSVWTNVCLSTDSFNILSFVTHSLIYVMLAGLSGGSLWLHVGYSLVLAVSIAACAVRILNDSEFFLFHSQERRIIESMRISQMDLAAGDMRAPDGMYKDIYDRLLVYFEEEKPYLNSDLTINDVVKVVYSNKVYISRAIGQYTGRNFRQYVNYYRVTHAVELFRGDPDLRITEMANRSGFNSLASFNMAFKLFMGERPGDWCRKERNRRVKNKKLLAE